MGWLALKDLGEGYCGSTPQLSALQPLTTPAWVDNVNSGEAFAGSTILHLFFPRSCTLCAQSLELGSPSR